MSGTTGVLRWRTWLIRVRNSRQSFWLLPGVAGAVAVGYLAWGAWVSAHDPRWPYLSGVWWRVWLRPDTDGTLLATAALGILTLIVYWWPRRRLLLRTVGVTTVVALVVIGAVLTAAAFVPCRGGQAISTVVSWILDLYTGNATAVYQTATCPGQLPLALQLGQIVCPLTTLVSAIAVGTVLWGQPWGRLRGRLVRDVTVFTGLDTLTLPMLQQLAGQTRSSGIVVVEPDENHPMLAQVRASGARVMIADPASPQVLRPVLVGWRGCTLRYLYALHPDVPDNERILVAARDVLQRYPPGPERQPHLVARIDDPRHAAHWRGWHSGTSSLWFEDALSAQETTAYTVANRIFATGTQQLLLCGDSTLALAILLELAHRAWQDHGLAEADRAGQRAHANGNGHRSSGPRPRLLKNVLLLDQRAADLKREYEATAPRSAVGSLPVTIRPAAWQDRLLAVLDGMRPAERARTAVVIADSPTESGTHEAGRVARLHREVPVFMLSVKGSEVTEAIFDRLHPFQRVLLTDRAVSEDTWTRVARHWHECYRLQHPPRPGVPQTAARLPWAQLDEFYRQDNILQLRSVMTLVVGLGRRWVPAPAIPLGSHVELTERELIQVARQEHQRWSQRRLADGWRPSAGSATAAGRVNSRVVPWHSLPPDSQEQAVTALVKQLDQLREIGFVPALPQGGPDGAAYFQRVGIVQAWQLPIRWHWTWRLGTVLSGKPGDWRVLDENGQERTIQDVAFHASHEPLGGNRWLRTGTFRAWQVSEKQTVRSLEGTAEAQPGDWIVEGARGERWPVPDRQFRRTYRRAGGPAAGPDAAVGQP